MQIASWLTKGGSFRGKDPGENCHEFLDIFIWTLSRVAGFLFPSQSPVPNKAGIEREEFPYLCSFLFQYSLGNSFTGTVVA